MKIVPGKTVRFTELVKQCGKPELTILWTEPEKDAEFWKALKQRRVATVIQQNVGSKTDYGLVGFFRESHTAFLIFPKELPYPDETKIVGLKYEQIEDRAPRGEIYKATTKKEAVRTPEPPAPRRGRVEVAKAPEPALPPTPPPRYKFVSKLELTARQTCEIAVEATTAAEAQKLVEARASELQMDLAVAKQTRKVSKPRRR